MWINKNEKERKTTKIKVGSSNNHDWNQNCNYIGYSFVLDSSLMEFVCCCQYQVITGFCKVIKDNFRFYVKISGQ